MNLKSRMHKVESNFAVAGGGDVCRCEQKRYGARNVSEWLAEFFHGDCQQCGKAHTPQGYTWIDLVKAENGDGRDYERFTSGEWERLNESGSEIG